MSIIQKKPDQRLCRKSGYMIWISKLCWMYYLIALPHHPFTFFNFQSPPLPTVRILWFFLLGATINSLVPSLEEHIYIFNNIYIVFNNIYVLYTIYILTIYSTIYILYSTIYILYTIYIFINIYICCIQQVVEY